MSGPPGVSPAAKNIRCWLNSHARRAVPVYGLNYKDKREDALAWLKEFGNPYLLSATDTDGRVGIDYGVYGVPETYLIDRDGVIRYKQIGPMTPEVLQKRDSADGEGIEQMKRISVTSAAVLPWVPGPLRSSSRSRGQAARR